MGNMIADDFKHGKNFEMGHFCFIEPDVIVGDDVELGHYVHLKSGTRMMNDVKFADHCKTTGLCIIGNHVNVRTDTCISKSVIVDDWEFIGAGVMSSHTKNVYHGRPGMEKCQLITRIGYGSIIGSRTNLMAGITIAPGVIVGYDSNVIKDLDVPHSIYLGHPARIVSQLGADDPWYILVPDDYVPHEFDTELLKRYLPFYKE